MHVCQAQLHAHEGCVMRLENEGLLMVIYARADQKISAQRYPGMGNHCWRNSCKVWSLPEQNEIVRLKSVCRWVSRICHSSKCHNTKLPTHGHIANNHVKNNHASCADANEGCDVLNSAERATKTVFLFFILLQTARSCRNRRPGCRRTCSAPSVPCGHPRSTGVLR